ncbi:MAG: hypothetical protein D6705_18915, partial [Deltaproteobacteria bacterium]
MPPDLPAGCRPDLYGECDPWCQDCPEGEKCLPWASDGGNSFDATRCSPVAPNPKGPGEACTYPEGAYAGVDDCDAGLRCTFGRCLEMCSGSPEEPLCSRFDAECDVCGDLFGVCEPWCHPLGAADRQCMPGDHCIYHRISDEDAVTDGLPHSAEDVKFVCVLVGNVSGQGAPCMFPNACKDGFDCVDAALVPGCQSTAGCCTAWCSLAAPECPDGTVCTQVLEPHPQLPPEF